MKKKMILLLGILAVLFMLNTALAADPIKIGVTYDQTGACAHASIHAMNGLLIAVDEINAGGGIKGRTVELISIDGQCTVEKALGNVKRFIQKDNVDAIIGPMYTGPSMAAMPVVNKAKILLVTGSGGNPINEMLAEKPGEKQFLFSLSMGIVFQHEFNMHWLKKKGITKVAMINPLNKLGEGSNTWYRHFAPKFGIQIVASENYDPASMDLTPQLIKLKATNPGAIVTMASGADGSIMVKNFHQLGMKIPLITSDANITASFIESLEGKTGYVYGPAPISCAPTETLPANDPRRKRIEKFLKDYEKKFGKKSQSINWEGVGYDSLMVTQEAIKNAGGDQTKMRDYIENLQNFPGINATYTFSATNHRGYSVDQLHMFSIKGNAWHLDD
jgi:branched-chain amino acid transport system substrate-binding protein